jgi:WD40 repeat protein
MEPRIFDGESLKEVRKFEKQPGSILAAAFSADGGKLALAGTAPQIRIYRAGKADRISVLESPGGWIYALAFNGAGNHLATAGYEGVVRIWDLDSGRKIASVVPVVLEPEKK